MSTEETIRDRKHEAAKAGDFDAFHRLEEEERTVRHEAIHRGIEDAESRPYHGRELTQLEREAVVSATERVITILEEEHVPDDQVLVIAERYARSVMADSVLRAKLEVAFNLEYDVCDYGIEDGILGRAVDGAIEDMLPYVKRRGGWYTKSEGTSSREKAT